MVIDNFEATRFPEYFDYPTAMRSRISKKMPPRWTPSGRIAAKMVTTIRTATSYLGCLPRELALWMFTLLRTPGIWAMLKMIFNVLEKGSWCFRWFLMFLKNVQGASDVFLLKVFEGCHQNRGRHISSWSPLIWEWGRFLHRFSSKSERNIEIIHCSRWIHSDKTAAKRAI